MQKVVMIVRFLLGLIFTVFGLNGFLHFLPMPPPEGIMGEMMTAYLHMGYMFPLIFATQLAGGLMLLTNMFVPLALAILAPVIVNIVLVHVFLAPEGLPVALVVLIAELFLAYAYRQRYAPMLRVK